MDKSAEEDGDLKRSRSKWRRFLSFVFHHLLPIPFVGYVVFGGFVLSQERGVFLVGAPGLVAVLLVTIATRACLESLICLLLMSEAVCLTFFYEQPSWPVVWTRVTVLQLVIAIALFFWLTILRVRKREFNTWLFCTEIITVLSFATNIYIHAAYWLA